MPPFGTEGFGLLRFPQLPTELAFFVDGGVVWSAGDPPKLKLAARSTELIPVFSTGVSTRLNLFNVLVLEVYYAYPFERPDKGGNFGFQLAPGW